MYISTPEKLNRGEGSGTYGGKVSFVTYPGLFATVWGIVEWMR